MTHPRPRRLLALGNASWCLLKKLLAELRPTRPARTRCKRPSASNAAAKPVRLSVPLIGSTDVCDTPQRRPSRRERWDLVEDDRWHDLDRTAEERLHRWLHGDPYLA